MILKKYQEEVAQKIQRYLGFAKEKRDKWLLLDKDSDFDWVRISQDKFCSNTTIYKTPSGQAFPLWTIKIPTGGGKTILATQTIADYFDIFKAKKTGLVVWLIHSEAIYSQTVNALGNKTNLYRTLLDNNFANRVIIKTKGENINSQELSENLVILILMYPSLSRKNKDSLKLFADSGSMMDFFPSDSKFDAHQKLFDECSFLDIFERQYAQTQVKTSVANFIRINKPLIIIDEIHNFFTALGLETLEGLNPAMVFGFSATPKNLEIKKDVTCRSNNLVEISGKQLDDEQMIKLDLNVFDPQENENWQSIVQKAIFKQQELEQIAILERQAGARNIRPIVIIQAEYTGKDIAKGIHIEDVKKYLITAGIPETQIKRKTSDIKDELENGMELLKQNCETRYILCKDALKEGWDCPFAYILVILPNSSSGRGMEQLVGRVLRQPFQVKFQPNKTKRQHPLDQSYVYYRKGQTKDILTQINKGFESIGMGDLASKINSSPTIVQEPLFFESNLCQNATLHSESLYLPTFWNNIKNRKYSPKSDIEAGLEYANFKANLEKIVEKCRVFTKQLVTKFGYSQNKTLKKSEEISNSFKNQDPIIAEFLISELIKIVENPFLAAKISKKLIAQICQDIRFGDYQNTSGSTIVGELIAQVKDFKIGLAKQKYEQKIVTGEIGLVLGDFRFAKTTASNSSSQNSKYLYEYQDYDDAELTGIEDALIKNLKKQKNLLWYYRNPVKTGYKLNGYLANNIYPDFIATKLDKNGKSVVSYIYETKGEQLDGNMDTQYKKYTFGEFNKLMKSVRKINPNIFENDTKAQAKMLFDANEINQDFN